MNICDFVQYMVSTCLSKHTIVFSVSPDFLGPPSLFDPGNNDPLNPMVWKTSRNTRQHLYLWLSNPRDMRSNFQENTQKTCFFGGFLQHVATTQLKTMSVKLDHFHKDQGKIITSLKPQPKSSLQNKRIIFHLAASQIEVTQVYTKPILKIGR